MTENGFRTGPARDVPPPRPVSSPAPAPEGTGVGRAARAVADAVAGLVGSAGGRPGEPAGTQRRSAGTGLRDVVGAVAGAVGAAFAPGRDTGAKPDEAASSGSSRLPLGDLLSTAAPRLPIRDADRLRKAFPGASDSEIADALVARAARLTSTIGAATGGISATHWLAPASLLALPLELGAETVLIAGVEIVLIGELHELYGRSATGDPRGRARAYLDSWSAQRAVDGGGAAAGLGSVLGGAGIRALQRAMPRKLAGAVPTTAPFLIGAAISGRGNRRATETLAERVLADLRGARPPDPDS